MRALSASRLLSVWERAHGRSQVERALALLAAACPEQTPEELARLAVGRRDRLLLTLRERTFGPRMMSRALCEECGEPVELTFEVSDIVAEGGEADESLALQLDGYDVHFRLPNSEDVSAVSANGDAAGASRLLLARCLLRVSKGGEEAAPDELPEQVREEVGRRMAEADPQSDVQMALTCPACGHGWLAPFDIVSYFWDEINAWAQRTLREVHTLASAYGWREEDILAMTPWRRHAYLEMIGG
jgi:hypothetical protein